VINGGITLDRAYKDMQDKKEKEKEAKDKLRQQKESTDRSEGPEHGSQDASAAAEGPEQKEASQPIVDLRPDEWSGAEEGKKADEEDAPPDDEQAKAWAEDEIAEDREKEALAFLAKHKSFLESFLHLDDSECEAVLRQLNAAYAEIWSPYSDETLDYLINHGDEGVFSKEFVTLVGIFSTEETRSLLKTVGATE
jgi:hypothetical protein